MHFSKILQDLSSVVDPDPVGSGIIVPVPVSVPDPHPDLDLTFLTRKSIQFLKIFLP
jgi:hypothetical protein